MARPQTIRSCETSVLCLMILGVVLAGCNRPPQLGAQNRRLLESLKTAVMAKNADWLEENARLIETRQKEGGLHEEEYRALASIIREARANNWSGAQDEVMSSWLPQAPVPRRNRQPAARHMKVHPSSALLSASKPPNSLHRHSGQTPARV